MKGVNHSPTLSAGSYTLVGRVFPSHHTLGAPYTEYLEYKNQQRMKYKSFQDTLGAPYT